MRCARNFHPTHRRRDVDLNPAKKFVSRLCPLLFLGSIPALAQPERHQAWCQLTGVQLPYDATLDSWLAQGPPLESVPLQERAALWGSWASSSDPQRAQQAQALRRHYLLSAMPASPPMRAVEPPFVPGSPKDLTFDALVVGSGPCGAVLAYTLVMAGWRVALIDKGPLVLPGSCDPRQLSSLQDASGVRPSENGLLLVRNAQAMGGGSMVNVDLAFPPTLPFVEHQLQTWRQRLGWPDGPEQLAQTYGWVESRLGTRQVTAEEVNANNHLLWEGARQLGFHPSLYRLNTTPPGSLNPGELDKHSALDRLIFPAMRRGLVVFPDCEVEELIRRGNRVVGLELQCRPTMEGAGIWTDPHRLGLRSGRLLRLQAPRTYLCAGSLGTALLLQRQGLGGSEVGRGPVMHPSFPLIGEFDHDIHADQGTPSSVYVADQALRGRVIYECMSGTPDYLALVLPVVEPQLSELRHNFARLGGFGVMLVDTPRRSNRLEPGPRLYYELDEPDRGYLARGVATAARMLLRAGAKRVWLPTSEDLLGNGVPATGRLLEITDESQCPLIARRLRFAPGRTLLTSAHMQSTCKMGLVVDVQGRVRGVEGLWVMDSSVFPSSVGANPMQSLYTLARRFALNQVRTVPADLGPLLIEQARKGAGGL